MTSSNVTPPPKRLHILDNEEIEALYGRPCFTGDERIHVFTLTQPEKDLLASFTHLPIQLYFLLQLGYFKAKQLFFTFRGKTRITVKIYHSALCYKFCR